MEFRELQEIAPDVFVFPRDTASDAIQPNIGVIRAPDQTILIDAGNGLYHARHILAAMAGGNFPPVETVIYTHHHWDHTFGACVYNAPQIIAHRAAAPYLAEYARREWNDDALQDYIDENPRLASSYSTMRQATQNWSRFRICQPTLTFEHQLRLYLAAGLTLELRHIAPSRHADDSIIAVIAEHGIVFLGDCYYPPPLHLREPGDDDLALWLLDELADEGHALYIDGHGAPRTLAQFRAMIAREKQRQNEQSA